MKTPVFIILFLFLQYSLSAQRAPDEVFHPNIKTIKFTRAGDPLAYPLIQLNSQDQLELHFDDLDGGVKNYFYTFTLCNADWTPVQMSYFDYVRGYTQVRISTYRNSSISLTRYTHYQATLPDRNCQPTKSGNYLLKVFVNGDTSKLAFTRRMLVVDNKMPLVAQVLQPFNQQFFQTHHRLQVQLDTKGLDVRYPQQQIKLVALQNYRWDNAIVLANPTFVRQDMVQYSNENEMLFPAGKEFRWLNLRSFRLLGDRITRQANTDSSFTLFVKEDLPRLPKQYFFYKDLNGLYINQTTENYNPNWNADYAKVHFTFRPSTAIPLQGADLVIMGELSNYGKDPSSVMRYNPEKGVFETDMLLKQGYYDYCYAIRTVQQGKMQYSTMYTEHDAWETENGYMVLVYYRALGGRYDELIALRQFNSQFNRNIR